MGVGKIDKTYTGPPSRGTLKLLLTVLEAPSQPTTNIDLNVTFELEAMSDTTQVAPSSVSATDSTFQPNLASMRGSSSHKFFSHASKTACEIL